MSDKELLELAAKAAGIPIIPCTCGDQRWPFKHDEAVSGKHGHWSPLFDDGDALRLAVALNLDVLQEPVSSKSNAVEVVANIEGIEFQPWAWECRAPDPCAATRRAIVRAAAEIGKTMP